MPSGTTDSSGTISAFSRRLSASLTVRNMPGFSAPSGFGNSARTSIARVVVSTRVSTLVMDPEKVRPGAPLPAAVTVAPGASEAIAASGT